MTDFIERRLMQLRPTGATVCVPIRGFPPVNVCSIILAEQIYTRVWNEHSTIHLEGDVDCRQAALRFNECDA